jgi:hypothetical protein
VGFVLSEVLEDATETADILCGRAVVAGVDVPMLTDASEFVRIVDELVLAAIPVG